MIYLLVFQFFAVVIVVATSYNDIIGEVNAPVIRRLIFCKSFPYLMHILMTKKIKIIKKNKQIDTQLLMLSDLLAIYKTVSIEKWKLSFIYQLKLKFICTVSMPYVDHLP